MRQQGRLPDDAGLIHAYHGGFGSLRFAIDSPHELAGVQTLAKAVPLQVYHQICAALRSISQ